MGEATKNERLGSGPIENEHRAMMRDLADSIDDLFNRGVKPKRVGFILMLFPFDGNIGRCNYISNAERKDVITLLKEQVKYFEGQSDTLKGSA